MDWAAQTNRRDGVMSATLQNHLSTFYHVSRYILECDGQVTESQLFWNVTGLTEEMYGFLLDFDYLRCDIDNDVMQVRISPLWEEKMRRHHSIKKKPVVQWSRAAEDELYRYAKVRRMGENDVNTLRERIENDAPNADYIGLLTVLRFTTPQ